MNKLFTVLGGKFKFSAQDSDLEYLFWQRKNSPVSSDIKPPLTHPEKPCMKWWKLFNSYDANFNITISFQKWLADNMGQVDSKRPMPSIQVQSLQTAHLPEKPRTPTPAKALLNVPKQHIR